jgi:hypothetical protein
MAYSEASITSATGETEFVSVPPGERAFIGVTGTISAGAVLVVIKIRSSATEYVADTIDATYLQTNGNEAGTGYSIFEPLDVPSNASVALVANAAFSGSVTAVVVSEAF